MADALVEFRRALAVRPESDFRIAEAWDSVKAQLQDGAVTEEEAERAWLASKRRDCLQRLRSITPQQDEETDRQIAAAWDRELLAPCPDVTHGERERHAECLRRLERLDDLRRALARQDHVAAAVIIDDPMLVGYQAAEALRHQIHTAEEGIEPAKRLVSAIRNSEVQTVLDLYDSELLADHPGLLGAAEVPSLRKLLGEYLLPQLAIGKPPPKHEPVWVRDGGLLRIRWQWPVSERLRICLVRISAAGFPESPTRSEPDQLEKEFTLREYQKGLSAEFPLASWVGRLGYVSVWPVLEVPGHEPCYGAALRLGPVRLGGEETLTSGWLGAISARVRCLFGRWMGHQ